MLNERIYVLMYVQYLTLKSVNYWKIALTSENSALMWEKSAFLWKIHWKMTPKPYIFFLNTETVRNKMLWIEFRTQGANIILCPKLGWAYLFFDTEVFL
jgi:hypothetical protein